MKLFVIDLVVKCVVLILAALIWCGPAHATADEVPDETLSAPVAPKTRPTVHPVPRTLLMTVAGTAGAVVGGFGGIAAGAMVGLVAGGYQGLFVGGVYGGWAGAFVGQPVGVGAAGALMDGNGKWWGILTGQVLGIGGVGLAYAMVHPTHRNEPGFLVAALVAPSLGAALGYELTSDRSAHEAKYGTSVAIQPTLTPLEDGMALGLNVSIRVK